MSVAETTTVSMGQTKKERLSEYLRQELADAEEVYFKAKFIADDVGLSTKEIGALIPRLGEHGDGILIEAWSYTGATTWRATRQ